MGSDNTSEEFTICDDCKNPIENCTCVCPFCGERDKCECALKLSTDDSAATGGWNCYSHNRPYTFTICCNKKING